MVEWPPKKNICTLCNQHVPDVTETYRLTVAPGTSITAARYQNPVTSQHLMFLISLSLLNALTGLF